WLANAPRYILRGGMITLLLLIAAAIMNHWSKVSLHTLFATYCTVIFFRVNIFCGSAALILAGLVFWSRLLLSLHLISENISVVARLWLRRRHGWNERGGVGTRQTVQVRPLHLGCAASRWQRDPIVPKDPSASARRSGALLFCLRQRRRTRGSLVSLRRRLSEEAGLGC